MRVMEVMRLFESCQKRHTGHERAAAMEQMVQHCVVVVSGVETEHDECRVPRRQRD